MTSVCAVFRGGALALALLLWATPLAAQGNEPDLARQGAVLPAALSSLGWTQVSLPGQKAALFDAGGRGAIEVTAEAAVGFLYRPVAGAAHDKRFITWRWKVLETSAASDLSQKGADDRPLALHIWFPKPEKEIGFWEGLKHSLGELAGLPVPGKVLTYVWGGRRDRGSWLPNPHLEEDGMLIVRRAGDAPTGQWFKEKIDFVADFEQAFGYAPPAPQYIAISTDCDDQGGRARAVISHIGFLMS